METAKLSAIGINERQEQLRPYKHNVYTALTCNVFTAFYCWPQNYDEEYLRFKTANAASKSAAPTGREIHTLCVNPATI